MDIFDLIKPFLKQNNLTDEQIEELREEIKQPRKFEDLPDWAQEHEILRDKRNEWHNKVDLLVNYAKSEDFNKIKLEEIPTEPIEIDGFYFYLARILSELYPFRKHFAVLNILHQSIHTIIDKWDIIKEALIIREIRYQKANNYNKEIENAREKAEFQINKIKFEDFIDRSKTIDFLYEKALKNRKE